VRAALVIGGLAVAAGCGEPPSLGLDQPLRVRGATFRPGPLPGVPADGAAPETPAAITLVETMNTIATLGEPAKRVNGRATTDTVAIGVALAGAGDGWWVLPVGAPDPTAGNEYSWTIEAGLGWDLAIGPGAIDLVAIDGDGRAGRQTPVPVCVVPTVPDNLSTCDPTRAPPHTVVSLTWDRDVDLDLRVRTPSGKLVDHEHPTTIDQDAPITPADLRGEHVGILDRDSNAACRIDGFNRENLVWQTSPLPGPYLIYAGLSDACGQASVRLVATVYRSEPAEGGAARLVEVRRQEAQLVGIDADGGHGAGLFLMQLALE
jgi:hypothetical protein